eukprot:gene13057-biopygen321
MSRGGRIRERNRAGIEAGKVPVSVIMDTRSSRGLGIEYYLPLGFLSLRLINLPVLCPRFGQVRVPAWDRHDVRNTNGRDISRSRDRQLRLFQLDSGHEHSPSDMSS